MLPEEIREPAVTEEEEPVPTEMDTENEDHNTDPAVHANQEEELPAADEDDSEGDVSEGILENDDPADDSIEADAEPEQVENSDTETVAALETSTSNPTMEVSETTDLEMETLEKEPEIAELPAEQSQLLGN